MSKLKNIPDILPTLSDATVNTSEMLNKDGKERGFVTTGEHIHKWGTYLSVDWLINATLGVAFAYWGKVTEIGKKCWSGPISSVFEKALFFIKDKKSRDYGIEKGNMFISIIAGGMFTIPILMGLENNKVKKSIVQFFDRMIHGKDKVENDPEFQQAYKEIDEAPKKDFWSGMTSRFVSLAPLLALTVFIPKTRDALETKYFEPISNFSDKVATKLGFTGKNLKQVEAYKNKEGKTVSAWKFIHDNVAFDLGQGIPYAILHAITYNMFVKGKDKKKAKDAPKIEPKTEPSPAVETVVAEAEPAKKFTEKKDIATAEASHAASVMSRRSEAELATGVQA